MYEKVYNEVQFCAGHVLSAFAACSKDDNTDVNTASVTGYWVCYYQCWSEDGETWESNYNGDDYYINFSSHLADGKYEGI